MSAQNTEAKRFADPVAEGVQRFDDGIVNWYLVEEAGAFTAIDSGFPPDWSALVDALGGAAKPLSALKAVVLTHGHIDHIGFAERARVEAGARVLVHEADAELLRHPLRIAKSERTPLRYLNHGATRSLVAHALKAGAPRAKSVREFETFVDGVTLDVPGSPRVLYTPGHTNGHCALDLPDRDLVFTGDAVVTRNPYTGQTGPRIVSGAATADSEQNLRTLDRIAETGATLLLPGHGEPWSGGAVEAVRLAREAGAS